MADDKRVRIAQETLDIYAPIANRLGMSRIKNELEELSFRYLEPAGYLSLKTRVDAKRRPTEGMIEQLAAEIRSKLNEAQVPVISIDGRVKRLYSIWLKLKAQKIDLEQVYDFVALRIVTPSVKDCYAALGIIHQTWSPVPGRIKDFIAMPRPNGYQSLHTSVISDRGFPFEVQIRTEEMHRLAEEGIAAHWKYKEGRVGAERDEQYFQWLRQLLEWQQEVRDPQEFLSNLKIDLYPEEVYTFTPRGTVKVLPKGATAIDFAYAIHTDVGHQCVGARVNGRMVPLRTRLKNGDIVEIVRNAAHKPSRDWLNFAVTSRARNKIKHLIQVEEKERAVELGRRVFEKEARRFGLNGTKLLEGDIAKVLAEFATPKPEDLLAQIGYGKVSPRLVLDKIVPHGPAEGAGAGAPGRLRREARAAHRRRARSHQGARRRRCDGVPGEVLQPDPRREDRRLHHARQGRVRALREVRERGQPDVRPRAPHRRRVGQGQRHRALHRPPDDRGRGSQGHARGALEAHLRHQHQHHQRRGAHRRSARAHRRDGRDQGHEAPRAGDQVRAWCRRCVERRASGAYSRAPLTSASSLGLSMITSHSGGIAGMPSET